MNPPMNPPKPVYPGRGNGPQQQSPPADVEKEIGALVRTVERTPQPETKHPALIACEKAAEMVRAVHERHSAEGETLAMHLEKIGETFLEMCKEAADQVRKQRILTEPMATKMADELVDIGKQEFERQTRVSKGLTAARDAILGIDHQGSGGQ